MDKKYIDFRRLEIPVLTAMAILLSSGTFVSEDELKVFAESTDSVVVEVNDIKKFTDYNTDSGYGKLNGHWAENDIQVLIDKGAIKGIENDDGSYRFEANNTVTTAQFFAMILQVLNMDYTTASDGTVWDDPWDERVLLRSIGQRYTEQLTDGFLEVSNFSYWYATRNEPITRERVAFIFCSLLPESPDYGKDDTGWDNWDFKNLENVDTIINDLDNVSDLLFPVDLEGVGEFGRLTEANMYKKNALIGCIRLMYAKGILGGDNNGNFNPQGELTRAEATAVINRFFLYTDRLDTSAIQALGITQGFTEEELARQAADHEKTARQIELYKSYERGELPDDGRFSSSLW
jgi:hypothetical protein